MATKTKPAFTPEQIKKIQQAKAVNRLFGWVLAAILFYIVMTLATGCKKDVLHPQQFHKGDKVKLDGINPKKSFQPYNCCSCPCTIDSAYIDAMYPYNWFYNLHDLNDSTLTHVIDYQIKKAH